jgi:hypothetical protein
MRIEMRPRITFFWLLALLQLWLAHAVCFMMHEYAHSFTAWALPLALNYGGLNLDNVLFQADIDENVDYAPIFAAGRGPLASLIAVAGVLIGNGISYVVGRLFYTKAKENNKPAWAMFFFWICLMSVGNFLSYVPIRTFTTHADMATTVQGLHGSPWLITLILGVPFAIAIWHFFAHILPDAEAFLFPESLLSQRVLVLLTAFLVFVFFGGSGIRNYGNSSHWLSTICELLLFPVVTILCWNRRGRAGYQLPR